MDQAKTGCKPIPNMATRDKSEEVARRMKQQAGCFAEVLFDSLSASRFEGTRFAGNRTTRQLLFRAGPYQVDVKVEVIPDSVRLSITGQLLDVSVPEMVAREAQVILSNRRGNLVHMLTNEFGEFRGEIEKSDDLEIILPGRSGKPITISLRNALV